MSAKRTVKRDQVVACGMVSMIAYQNLGGVAVNCHAYLERFRKREVDVVLVSEGRNDNA